MVDVTPLRLQRTGASPTAIAEMQDGETTPVSHGGTGATTPAAARASLGAMSLLYPGMRNLLINGDMLINQRQFAGGTLAANTFGYDRWRSASGAAATISVNTSSGLITHTSGSAIQAIENIATLTAGRAITISVEDPTANISVFVGASAGTTTNVTGTITAGSGRRSVTVTPPAGGSGHLYVNLTAASATYRRIQCELGDRATEWDARPAALEILLCQRYCWAPAARSNMGVGHQRAGSIAVIFYRFPVEMRVAPTVTVNAVGTIFDPVAAATLTPSGVSPIAIGPDGCSLSCTGIAGTVGTAVSQNSVALIASAEI